MVLCSWAFLPFFLFTYDPLKTSEGERGRDCDDSSWKDPCRYMYMYIYIPIFIFFLRSLSLAVWRKGGASEREEEVLQELLDVKRRASVGRERSLSLSPPFRTTLLFLLFVASLYSPLSLF